jgi:RNA polymerase sigma-70 factor (ECF subfamily)
VLITAERNAPEVTQLYQEITDELRSLLLCKTENKEQADDIAQQTYLKLCRLKYHRDIQDLRGYLSNIALRLAINLLRKRRSLHVVDTPNSNASVIDRAYQVLMDELKTEAIKESIEGLSDKTRYVFLLHRYRGLGYSEIAKHLVVSVALIEHHMDLALATINRAVAEIRAVENERGYSY